MEPKHVTAVLIPRSRGYELAHFKFEFPCVCLI